MNYLSYIVIMVIDVEWKLMERELEFGFVMEIYEYCFCSIIEWCVVNLVNY